VIDTKTPGFDASLYGSNTKPVATSFKRSGWQQLNSGTRVVSGRQIALNGHGRKFAYFLIWITRLPAGRNYAAVNEIKLYR
jgi:hypothetical protein